MKPRHYEEVIRYWGRYTRHGARMANGYARNCNQRYQTQLELPFPALEGDDDATEEDGK